MQRNLMKFLEGERGTGRTTESGRCAAPAGTSPTRRCSLGLRSTVPFRRSSASRGPGRSIAGGDVGRNARRGLREGFDVELDSFTQAYGSEELDAARRC